MKQFCLVALLMLMASGCEGDAAVVVMSSPSPAAANSAGARAGSQTSTAKNSTSVTVGGGSASVSVSAASNASAGGGSSTAVSRSSVTVSSGSDCTVTGAVSPGPSRVVSKSASGDTFSLTFDRGVPNFLAVSQTPPRFTSESGESVQLAGSAGLRITLSGLQTPGDPTGASSLMPGGQELLELRKIADAGGVVIWAVGLRQPACPTAVASGSTLTFRFR